MKKNKKIIIITTVSLIVLVTISITVFMYLTRKTPTKTVNMFFSSISSGNIDSSNQFLDNTETTTSYVENAQNQTFFKKYVSSIHATVLEEKQEKDSATIKVAINKIDMQTIFEKYISEVYSNMFSNLNKTESQLNTDSNTFFDNELSNPNVQKIDKEYTLNLVKINKEWKIVNDDNLSKAILDVEPTSNKVNQPETTVKNPTK
ncbi:MAG: hypothetical protein RSE00_04465 [Clostridia bacterium]